jgi:hypothetical protein
MLYKDIITRYCESSEFHDHVFCCNCGTSLWVPMGEDICPRCCVVGCLSDYIPPEHAEIGDEDRIVVHYTDGTVEEFGSMPEAEDGILEAALSCDFAVNVRAVKVVDANGQEVDVLGCQWRRTWHLSLNRQKIVHLPG